MTSTVNDLIVSGAMFTLMFSMGLTLHASDFQRIARTPQATIIGTVLQLVIMPMIGLGLCRYFELPPLLTAGVVVIAACPGGMFSNMLVHMAGGRTALSITLTATATLVTLITLPLWVRFALSGFTGTDAAVEMPIFETALRLSTLTVLPVGIGMWTRSRRPETVDWERRLSRTSAILIAVCVTFESVQRPDFPMEELQMVIAPVISFAIAALLIGIVVPALFGLSAPDGVTIAVELIVKNTLLGIVLVNQTLDFNAIVPILVFSIVQTPAGILLLVGWRLLASRGLVEGVRV